MDYNSNRKKLLLPEYGRNIQNMVNHVMTIEDRDERNKAAQTVIDVMGNLYPYLRDVADFNHKLWDHLAIMTNFELDIDYPYDLPTIEVLGGKPDKIPYSSNRIRYRHYGRVVEMMIERATSYDDGQEKDLLIQMIADHMKKCYVTWNNDSVDDSLILSDFEELSKGKLKLPDNFQLAQTKTLMQKPKRRPQHNNNNNNNKRQNYSRRN